MVTPAVDPGFPRDEQPTFDEGAATYYLANFSAKPAWKWKNLDQEGGRDELETLAGLHVLGNFWKLGKIFQKFGHVLFLGKKWKFCGQLLEIDYFYIALLSSSRKDKWKKSALQELIKDIHVRLFPLRLFCHLHSMPNIIIYGNFC